jgi:hypothetical protein
MDTDIHNISFAIMFGLLFRLIDWWRWFDITRASDLTLTNDRTKHKVMEAITDI